MALRDALFGVSPTTRKQPIRERALNNLLTERVYVQNLRAKRPLARRAPGGDQSHCGLLSGSLRRTNRRAAPQTRELVRTSHEKWSRYGLHRICIHSTNGELITVLYCVYCTVYTVQYCSTVHSSKFLLYSKMCNDNDNVVSYRYFYITSN